MSSTKDNNISNSNNRKDKYFSSNSKPDYDKRSAKQTFEDVMKDYPGLKIKRKPAVRNKVRLTHDVLPPLRDALEKAADISDENRSSIIDRFLEAGLKKEFPEIFERMQADIDQMVLRPHGKTGVKSDDGFDPEP